jgi:O-antigen ligase
LADDSSALGELCDESPGWFQSFPLSLRQPNPLFWLCAAVLSVSLLLGGGTRPGFLADSLVALFALPLLALGLSRLMESPLSKQAQWALLFCAGLVLLPLIQLIPLPPWLWTWFPSRGELAAPFEAIAKSAPWLPLSVTPEATWIAMLALIAPLAIFIAMLLLTYEERRRLSLVILGVGTIGVFIGLLQVSQGPESSWRFYDFTNPTEAVGFFANRNHFAALGYTLLLLAVVWAIQAAVSVSQSNSLKHFDTTSIVSALAAFCLLVVLLAGEAMARSRAGLGLTIVALFGAFALGVSDRRLGANLRPRSSQFTANKLLLAALLFAGVLIIQYALYRILQRFEIDPLADARLSFVPTTLKAALAYFPFGAGLGSFVPVYAGFERPQDSLLNIYANHAHNDAAEFLLEAGLMGLLLMTAFVIWLAWRAFEVWRTPPPAGALEIDWSLVRASTLIIALILAHSFVDYPLRTGAMMAIMAFCVALLIEPLVKSAPATERGSVPRSSRRRSKPQLAPAPASTALTISPHPQEPKPRPAPERWGDHVAWPEPWQIGRSQKPGPSEG